MAFPLKATNEQLVESYSELGSIWKVAAKFGMCGQSVQERLNRLKVIDNRRWTDQEDLILIQLYGRYKETMFLDGAAKALGRSYAAIACRANELGITDNTRRKSEQHKDNLTLAKIANGTILKNRNKLPSRSKVGKRADLGEQFFRSCTEANYARYLSFVGEEWEYEPHEFFFPQIKRGSVAYIPDFYNKTRDQWVEVKGWFDPKSVTKLKRFKKYFPAEFQKLTMVTQSKRTEQLAYQLGIPYQRFEEIKKQVSALIPGWEFTQRS